MQALTVDSRRLGRTATVVASSGAAATLAPRLLRTLIEHHEALNLQELAEAAAVRPSQAYRALQGLLEEGLVALDPAARRYEVGAEFLRLGAIALATTPLPALAGPVLRALVAAAQESAYLHLYEPQRGMLTALAFEEGPRPLRYALQLGQPLLLHAGASGKSILAFVAPDEIDAVIERHGLPRYTARTITTRKRLLADLATIREQGYAFSKGERIADAVGIAAPVFNAAGRIVGSLQVTVPKHRFRDGDERRLIPLVVAHAARLSEALGHRPPSRKRSS